MKRYTRIAREINAEMRTQGGVDAGQVRAVAEGRENTVSHQVISAIRAKLRENVTTAPKRQ